MDISSIALQGLQQADVQLEAAAAGLASSGGNSASPAVDTVGLPSQIVALTSAQTSYAVNVESLKTVDQVQKTLINLLA
jgi:flagellar hook protein FlgE